MSALVLFVGVLPAAAAVTKPSAPRSLTANGGPATGSVTLQWLAPTTTGGAPITGYTYDVSTNGGTTWDGPHPFGSTNSSGTATCANSGVANNGDGCRYRVHAVNSKGASAASNVVQTWVVPASATQLTGMPTDDAFTNVALTWTASKTTGGFASVSYAVQQSADGSAFSTVTTTSTTSATVACSGGLTCAYRVVATNLQGDAPPSNAITIKVSTGAPQSFSAVTQSTDKGTGVSTVRLSWFVPTAGASTDHFDLQTCTVAAGAKAGCGPTAATWSASDTISPPFGSPVVVTRPCSAGVATCYYRVRAVNANGGASTWRTINLQPWAVTAGPVPGPALGDVTVQFSGPVETGPNGSAKFYTAFVCTTGCTSDTNWTNTGLTIPYPPAGVAPYTAGIYACGVNVPCQFRMQFTDGRGNTGVVSTAVTAYGAALVINTPAEGARTNDTTPNIGGACTIGGGTVSVSVDSGAFTFNASCNGAGAWSGNVPNANALTEGTHTAVATQANTLQTSNTRTFVIDTTAPVVTLAAPANGSTSTSSTITLSGTCSEVGSTVTVNVTGPPSPVLTTSCDAPGTFSVAQGLPNHAYTAKASQTDVAGNTGTSTTIAFTVNAPLPTVTITTPPNGGFSRTNPTTVSGLCTTAAGTVTLVVTGPTPGTSTTNCTAGAWSTSIATADGAYSAVASQTDTVGNTGTSGPSAFTVDTAAPTISASATKADASPYVAGTWTNQTVTVHYTCSDTGSGLANCPSDQVFSTTGQTASTSGTATDNAGNSASASFGPIRIDKVAPTAAVTFPMNGATYNATTWAAGCATAGVCGSASDANSGLSSTTITVKRNTDNLYWNGTAFVAGPVNVTNSGTAAAWKAALPASALTSGATYTVTGTATDTAGNVATATSTFTYDTSTLQITSASVQNHNGAVQGTGVDTLTMVFNKPVKASTVPTTATLTLQRIGGGNSGTTFWGISGLTILPDGSQGSGNTTAAKGYFGNGGGTATWDGTVSLSVDRKTITFTVTGACTGTGCSNLSTSPSSGAWEATPAQSLTDDAGNPVPTTGTGSKVTSASQAMF